MEIQTRATTQLHVSILRLARPIFLLCCQTRGMFSESYPATKKKCHWAHWSLIRISFSLSPPVIYLPLPLAMLARSHFRSLLTVVYQIFIWKSFTLHTTLDLSQHTILIPSLPSPLLSFVQCLAVSGHWNDIATERRPALTPPPSTILFRYGQMPVKLSYRHRQTFLFLLVL